MPDYLGWGYNRSMELLPGVSLNFHDSLYSQDLQVNVPAHDHEIQLGIHLSGFIYFDAVHPNLGGNCGYFSGSGLSPAYVEKYRGGERLTIVSVDIEPDWLRCLLADEQHDAELHRLLFKGEDWKVSFYPAVTPAMRTIAQQLWNAPYQGVAKRIYLQSKVLELLAMHLNLVASGQANRPVRVLKPATIDRIHQDKEMLLANLEQPSSVLELAAQVGVSDRTLQRGFQHLFGKTVFQYLTERRMERAEQWLRQGNRTVAEIAATVGYSNPGHFAAAFKRQFGITPNDCALGKKSVVRSSVLA